jgi:hypothetical protein
LDYIPQIGKDIKYDAETREFYIIKTLGQNQIREMVDVTDPEYFCNKSWTLSYNVNTRSWISFHSYIPNFYIAENNFFYSGINDCCSDIDAIATVILPPDPTTTTTSTSSSTTTTTTTIPLDCDLEGIVSILDCTLAGTARPADIPCNCYIITSITPSTQTFSYTQCDGTPNIDVPVLTGDSAYVCAQIGTLVVNGDYFNIIGPLGDCTVDGECEPGTTTTTSTTLCPNCKTYTLQNSTENTLTATQLVDCNTGLLYTFSVPGGVSLKVCSCNPPTVPTGMTSTEFADGCVTCFCYTITNLQGITDTVQYIDCTGNNASETVNPYSSKYICALQGTVSAGSMTIYGGTTSCTNNTECNCWDC